MCVPMTHPNHPQPGTGAVLPRRLPLGLGERGVSNPSPAALRGAHHLCNLRLPRSFVRALVSPKAK